jgi:hypothetical protein
MGETTMNKDQLFAEHLRTSARTTTKFIHTRVDVGNGALVIDGNSKITAGNGTYDEPVPNALSLPHIVTCPGATPACKDSCYVHGLKRRAPEIFAAYEHNLCLIRRVLATRDCRIEESAIMLGEWIEANAPEGFRWHVSGDVFSLDYALWIVRVCERSPTVQHWIYTRSFHYVGWLLGAPNLTVNLSADRDNYHQARFAQIANPQARLCYMAGGESIPHLPRGSVIFPDYPQRGRGLDNPTQHEWWKSLTSEQRHMACFADFFGQSEQHRCGPCSKCMRRPKNG